MQITKRSLLWLLISALFLPAFSYGLTFEVSQGEEVLFGKIQTAKVRVGEDFADVAQRFGVGYYEILEANPGIDPDNPPKGKKLIIPTQYILPEELEKDSVVINLAEMRLYYLSKSGDTVYVFPVGVGRSGWGTPLGSMSIVQKIKDPAWHVPDSIYKFRELNGGKIDRVVLPGPDNPLGKYALRLSNRTYLIHGTNNPDGVGRRSTAGCISLYPNDIEQLHKLISVGSKVVIINQPYKSILSGNRLYLEAHMPFYEQRMIMGNDLKSALDVVSSATKRRNVSINWSKVRRVAKDHLVVPRVVN